jgi:hypothetical protein
MSEHHTPTTVDPQALQEARTFWERYTQFATVAVIAIAALLLLMAFSLARP